MNTHLAEVFTKSLPTRRAALIFFWIAMGCFLLGVASIVMAEIYMPKNPHGQDAILTFYRSFGPWALFWLMGGAVTWVYAQTRLRERCRTR